MLTIKNQVGKNAVFFLIAALLFAGCVPPGPRALLQGRKLVEQGHYKEAIEKLRLATSLLHTNAQAWNYLGLAYHYADQGANAEQAYGRALALDRNLVEAHYNLGCLWLEENRPDRAKAEFMAYTSLRENSADGLTRLGAAQLRLREWTAAENSFDAALRLNARNPEALNGLALIRVRRNRPREAAQLLGQALKQQPDYAPALLNLAVVSQVYLKDLPFALQTYREYLSLKPRPPDWEAVNAVAAALREEINPPARPQAAVAPPPRAETAVASRSEERPPKPAKSELLASNLTISPPPTQSPPVVVEVTQPPAVKETTLKTSKPVASHPEPATPSEPIATGETPKPEKRSFFQRINPLNLFRRGRKPVPPSVEVSSPQAAPAVASNNEPDAAPTVAALEFPRYHYLSPPKPLPGDRAAAVKAFAQGVQEQQAGRGPEAIRAYQQATELDPADYDAYYNLGLVLMSSGDTQRALAAYETALALRPDSLDARYNFALALKQANYVLDSANELEKLVAIYPNLARAHLALGNLYAQQLHQPAKAREQYLRVLQTDPGNPQAALIRYWLSANPP